MNTEASPAAPAPRRAIVRAIPAPGHNYRWRAGMRWSSADHEVVIVDDPKPYNHANGPQEISPLQLEQLRSDMRLAVQVLGDGEEGLIQALEAQAKVQQLEVDLLEAREDLARAGEEHRRFKAVAEKQSGEAGARIAQLEADLAQATAQIAAAMSKVKPKRGEKSAAVGETQD